MSDICLTIYVGVGIRAYRLLSVARIMFKTSSNVTSWNWSKGGTFILMNIGARTYKVLAFIESTLLVK